MRVQCGRCIALALAVVVIQGCQRAAPEPVNRTAPGPQVVQAAQPASAVVAQPAQGDSTDEILKRLDRLQTEVAVLDRLDRIAAALQELADRPQLVATAAPGALTPAPPTEPTEPTPAEPEPSATVEYKVAPVSNGATIAGVVTYTGKPRPPKMFKVEKTPEVCGKEDRALQEVTVTDGKLQDAVLVLKGVASGKPFSQHTILGPPDGKRSETGEFNAFPGTLIQPQKCTFGSFTGVCVQGSALRFDNLDPVKHSPHTYEVKGRVRKSLHNQDLEGNGKLDLAINFKKATSKVIKLECDQHPHMQNWFYRVDNPYYAFSATDGAFKIDQVPAGKYTLIAWHPILGELEKEVEIAAGATADISFEFTGRRR